MVVDSEHGPERADATSWLSATGPTVLRTLVIPQGYTLSVGGTLAILLDRHPRPGAVPIWLFVVGAVVGFVLVARASNAHRDRAALTAAAGKQLFNAAPVLVVPLVVLATCWVEQPLAAFPAAGLACSSTYVLTVTAFFHLVGRQAA